MLGVKVKAIGMRNNLQVYTNSVPRSQGENWFWCIGNMIKHQYFDSLAKLVDDLNLPYIQEQKGKKIAKSARKVWLNFEHCVTGYPVCIQIIFLPSIIYCLFPPFSAF